MAAVLFRHALGTEFPAIAPNPAGFEGFPVDAALDLKIRFGLKQFQPPGNPETVAVPPLNGMAWMLELNAGDLVDGSIFASPALGAFYIVGPEQETVLYATHTMSIAPEENSNPRVVHISKTLIQMLNQLPRTSGDRIFSPSAHASRPPCETILPPMQTLSQQNRQPTPPQDTLPHAKTLERHNALP